jgi:hypothetical protein
MKIRLTFSTPDIHDEALDEVFGQDKDFGLKVSSADENEYSNLIDEKSDELSPFVNKWAPQGIITVDFDTVSLEAKLIPYDDTDQGHY